MGKRNRSDAAHEGETKASQQAPKRAKKTSPGSPDALALLLEHSEDLISCLQSLKASGGAEAGAVAQLKTLSKTLLPAIRTLSEEESPKQDADAAGGNGSSDQGPEKPGADKQATESGYILPLSNMTAWAVADIPKDYPPLPSIPDPTLEQAALTHEGMVLRRGDMSYEKLEFLGDAFIYHAAAEFIAQTFPPLPPGKSSQMRELLLRNSNLSQYTLAYGLEKRARFPTEFFGSGRPGGTSAGSGLRMKALGDLFEAYVGALIHSSPDGVSRALNWLKSLWAKTLKDEIRRGNEEYKKLEQEAPYKVQLLRLIGCKGVTVRYEDMPNGGAKDRKLGLGLYTIGIYVDGWGRTNDFLGSGSALGKKEAGANAAKHVLENKKALKFYMDKKKAWLAAQEAEKAASA